MSKRYFTAIAIELNEKAHKEVKFNFLSLGLNQTC